MTIKTQLQYHGVFYYSFLCIVAFVSGYLAIGLSFHYQFHDGLVSWYFPHAVRVVSLFVLPFRHWLIFLFVTMMGSDSFYHLHYPNEEGISLDTLKTFILYVSSEAFIGAGIYLLYKRYVSDWFTIKGVVWLLSLSVLYRFGYLIIPGILKSGFFSLIPEDKYIEYFAAIQLSGYLVGFYLMSIVYVYKWYVKHKKSITREDYIRYLFVIFGLLLVNAILFTAHPILEYILRIAMLIPLILIALRFGGFGVLLTSTLMVTALLIFLFDGSAESLLEYQPIILSYLMIGLLLSAVMFENARTQRQIINAKAILTQKNIHLSSLSQKMTDLSKKIINTQEQERKHLSQELHDEIGQNLIALKSSIYLAELTQNKSEHYKSEHYSAIKENADMMYSSVYDLMNWLRPSVLDKLGLVKTLEGGYFQERLALSDVQYNSFVNTTIVFSEHIETAIFRICQEAVSNVIKHSNATKFELYLSVQDETIHLDLKDNGSMDSTQTIEPSGSFGLNGIADRAMTLNGIALFTRQDGFVINVKIPLKE
jgi:two-component system sensor histidine kinase UhpB